MSYKNWKMLNENFNLGLKNPTNLGLQGSKMQEAGIKPAPFAITDEEDDEEEEGDEEDLEGEEGFGDEDLEGEEEFDPTMGDEEGGEDAFPPEDSDAMMSPEEGGDDFNPSDLEIDPALLGPDFEEPVGGGPMFGGGEEMGDEMGVPDDMGDAPMLGDDEMGPEMDMPVDDMGDAPLFGDEDAEQLGDDDEMSPDLDGEEDEDLSDIEDVEADELGQEQMRNYMKYMGKAHMDFMKHYMHRENVQYDEIAPALAGLAARALPAIGRGAAAVGQAAMNNPAAVGQAAHAVGQGVGGYQSGHQAGAAMGQDPNAMNMKKMKFMSKKTESKNTSGKPMKESQFVNESHDDFLSSLKKGAYNEVGKKYKSGLKKEDALYLANDPNAGLADAAPKAGDVGFAPQGRVGAVGGGGYQMSDVDLPTLGESKKAKGKKINECSWQVQKNNAKADRQGTAKAKPTDHGYWLDLAFDDKDFVFDEPVAEAKKVEPKKMGKKCMTKKCESTKLDESADFLSGLRKAAKRAPEARM